MQYTREYTNTTIQGLIIKYNNFENVKHVKHYYQVQDYVKINH